MAQSSHTFNDVAGLAHLAELNAEAEANATLNSGTTEPATKYPGMLWLDTSTTPVLKQRNQANNGWDTVSSLIDAEIMPSPVASAFVLRNAANDKNETKTAQQAAALLSPFVALGKNAIINGNFAINQRDKSGTVTLAAGFYGHDRWKAGASGCTYTFATSANVTTLTITAGSLQQVIGGANLFTDTYALSWQGTAQGKIGAGAYSASGVTGSVTGGANLTIEFGTGTLSLVQFERGTVATPFDARPESVEAALCGRYARLIGVSLEWVAGGASERLLVPSTWPPMRATPTATFVSRISVSNLSSATLIPLSAYSGRYQGVSIAAGVAFANDERYLLEAEL